MCVLVVPSSPVVTSCAIGSLLRMRKRAEQSNYAFKPTAGSCSHHPYAVGRRLNLGVRLPYAPQPLVTTSRSRSSAPAFVDLGCRHACTFQRLSDMVSHVHQYLPSCGVRSQLVDRLGHPQPLPAFACCSAVGSAAGHHLRSPASRGGSNLTMRSSRPLGDTRFIRTLSGGGLT